MIVEYIRYGVAEERRAAFEAAYNQAQAALVAFQLNRVLAIANNLPFARQDQRVRDKSRMSAKQT